MYNPPPNPNSSSTSRPRSTASDVPPPVPVNTSGASLSLPPGFTPGAPPQHGSAGYSENGILPPQPPQQTNRLAYHHGTNVPMPVNNNNTNHVNYAASGGITQRIHPHGVAKVPSSLHHSPQPSRQNQQHGVVRQQHPPTFPGMNVVPQHQQHQQQSSALGMAQQQQQQQQQLQRQQLQQQQQQIQHHQQIQHQQIQHQQIQHQQIQHQQQQAQAQAKQGFASVPNPLARNMAPAHMSSNIGVNNNSGSNHSKPHHISTPPPSIAPPQAQQPLQHQHQQHHQHQQLLPPPPQQQHYQPTKVTQPVPSSSSSSSIAAAAAASKPKVVLSHEAKQALAKAIWSAIRSPDGSVAPDLMDAAIATGLPRHAILNAARVAREREAQKRMQAAAHAQQGGSSSSGGSTTHAAVPSAASHGTTNMTPSGMAPSSRPAAPTKPVATSVASSHDSKMAVGTSKQPPHATNPPTTSSSNSAPTVAAPPSKEATAKLEEQSHWKRLQNGLLLVQKGRFMAVPNTVGAIVRSPSYKPISTSAPRKRPRAEIVSQAALLQRQLLQAASLPSTTTSMSAILQIDPEKYKRMKIEPKRAAKALDRIARKCRQSVAESLVKQHKELSKNIASHQQEFAKYHKSRRAEASRIAKAVRDSLDKVEKSKGRSVEQAERARIAALRANDMAAYSKLLEETKHHRLKYLLDKTDECISQISTLLQKRSADDRNSDAFTAASSASSGSYYASAHLKTEEVRQPSMLVGGELKEYQLAGLQWLVSLYNNQLNGILADEMGLGKTIQAIALVAYLIEFKQKPGPYLVIVPLSTLSNWQNEFAKWCPGARLVCYKGTPAQRKALYRDQVKNGHFNVLLTTYEYIIKDKSSLRKTSWELSLVDEGHRMKNASSKFSVTLGSQYSTKFRILLTGTPLMNDLSELWALLNFLLPSIFNSLETFDQWFNRPFSQFVSSAGSGGGDDEADQLLTNEERMLIIHRLHELLRPFMLRRVKSEVLDQLPEKVEKVLRCELSSWQKELYKQISAKAVADTSLMGSGDQQPTRGLNNVVMQLRKVCNHPFLFSPEGYHINENLIRSSGKVELLDRMLPKLRAAGHRVLMFTQMTAVMTILEDYFTYRGYLSLRLDGSTPAEEREKRMFKFNAPDSPYFIFLLSTRAGGLGLNLTAADTVIIFDSDWNPMMDLQAQDRAHRIGQRSDVSVFRLITYSPVEEKILSRATEKLNMSELVVEAGKFDRSSVENDNSMERKRLMEVLLTDFDNTKALDRSNSEPLGSEEGDQDDEGSEASDKEDLNELLSNNELDYQLYASMDVRAASDLSGVASSSLFSSPDDVPDWIKFPANRRNGGLKAETDADGSRKRKNVTYDDGLTEKQFLRLMERQADNDERARKVAKTTKGPKVIEDEVPEDVVVEDMPQENPSAELTDWTFRKLISCVKSVIALKDPATKRRLSDVFLEKPPPQTFPDYYEIIEKPIAINDILRKCRSKTYVVLQEFRDDWKLMFANARKFNGDDSWVVQDGDALQRELERVLTKNGFADEIPPSPKKKKLRIKLSLKTLKSKPEA